jgi:hypothetical protein
MRHEKTDHINTTDKIEALAAYAGIVGGFDVGFARAMGVTVKDFNDQLADLGIQPMVDLVPDSDDYPSRYLAMTEEQVKILDRAFDEALDRSKALADDAQGT